MRMPLKSTRLFSDRDCRLLILIFLPISLILLLSLTSLTATASFAFDSISSIFSRPTGTRRHDDLRGERTPAGDWKDRLDRSRIAVCLVGGARRLELTGPSIVENILKQYPNSDLFLHSPLDRDAYKLSLFKSAPSIASVRIFRPGHVPETESQLRVLSAHNSPNGIQGLLQYFNLVEGCLKLIKTYQQQNNFTYDWVVRTRVDGYWAGPLSPQNFVAGTYVVPEGSSFYGLNDRLGIGQLGTSAVALSRLSLVPLLDSAGFRQLNSERAFSAQLTTNGVPYSLRRLPFCIVSERKYEFPPSRFGVPVASISSPGPLSGAKCRPCKPVCTGRCAGKVMNGLDRSWSWTAWADGAVQLCDGRSEWEEGWERVFDRVAGRILSSARKTVSRLKMEQCVDWWKQMERRSGQWEAPPAADICRLGLG